jgi:mannose/fructose/N-acetylgalactosamine-specific phosphotransferase system component IID
MSRTRRQRHGRPLLAGQWFLLWTVVVVVVVVLHVCHAYPIAGDRSPTRRTADRRTFFTNAASCLGVVVVVGLPSSSPAYAVTVVAPGERQAKELKSSKRIGGLAAKIRDVGDIMVSIGGGVVVVYGRTCAYPLTLRAENPVFSLPLFLSSRPGITSFSP